jgi:hypothetical protein
MPTPDNTPNLRDIQVQSPCSENWDAMSGGDQRRFCDLCNKHVHNLSAMTAKKAETLLSDNTGNLCVRYERDADGTIKTRPRFYRFQKAAQKLSHLSQLPQIARVAVAAIVTLAVAPWGWASSEKKAPCPVNPRPNGQQVYKLGKPAMNHQNSPAAQPDNSHVEVGKPAVIQGGIPPVKPQPQKESQAEEAIMGDIAEPTPPQPKKPIEIKGQDVGEEMGRRVPPPEPNPQTFMGEAMPPEMGAPKPPPVQK